MQKLEYRPKLLGQVGWQTSASQDDSIDFAQEVGRPTGLTQLGYHYTPTPCNEDESIDMQSESDGFDSDGILSHGFFSQPPRRISDMDDSQTQAKDDENDDDDADIQDQESTDPSGQVIGISEVQTIGMYANRSRLYLYIYT
jgi:hypothetical protein